MGWTVPPPPPQMVLINGDRALPAPPTWGSGGFTVGETASLSVSYLLVPALPFFHE